MKEKKNEDLDPDFTVYSLKDNRKNSQNLSTDDDIKEKENENENENEIIALDEDNENENEQEIKEINKEELEKKEKDNQNIEISNENQNMDINILGNNYYMVHNMNARVVLDVLLLILILPAFLC